ncbi:MAG: hypothetical protein GF315_11075 [candidate division Zixibacteria bacterium]|nr:hypothetical protein [candidate division Zixibacteria bacterium]
MVLTASILSRRNTMTKQHIMTFVATLFVTFLVVVSATAERTTYVVTEGKPNKVEFISKAPLETIEGVTNKISGEVTIDPLNINDNPSANFEVQMADLDTGNSIRDGDMHEDHLHTDKHPTSSFKLKEIKGLSNGQLPDGQEVSFTAVGDFTLHGVTRTIEPQITTKWDSANNSIDVTAKFTVLLKDYDIPRPKFLFMKLSKEQKVRIDFTAMAK